MGFLPLALGAGALLARHKDKPAAPPLNPDTPGAIAARSPQQASAGPMLGRGASTLSL